MNTSRRQFLGGATASFFIGGCASRVAARKISPNSKVNVGIIGCGCIARSINVPGFLKDDRCRITTVCDVIEIAADYFYGGRGSNFGAEGFVSGGKYHRDVCGWRVVRDMVNQHYGDTACRTTTDWRDIIDDPAIDAVCICTPDHWHAIMAIAAMKAGKHVFCQKPMSLTVEEGKAMVQVAKETGVTFQVGNQGSTNPKYRLSEEIVLNGYAGKVKSATICIPACDHWAGHGRSAARAPLPRYLTKECWDMWQGPALHWENNAYIPSIHDPTCWRFNERYGGGMIPDFGAHEFDQLQRGLGTQLTGPVAIENMESNYGSGYDRDVFSWPSEFKFDIVYANGVRCHVRKIDRQAGWPRQTIFHCEKGDVGSYDGHGKVPEFLKNFKESDLTDKDIKLYRPNEGHDGSRNHELDFIDGILESRQVASTCEMGHRTITIAHIANICARMQLKALKWDPKAELFTGAYADEANRFLAAPYYNGWELGV
jgi:predicted dehydrogenase